MPLKADYDLASLKRHRDAGFDFVSINVGMDMTPIADVVSMIASFREQIARCPDFLPARSVEDVRAAAQQNKLAVGFDLEGAKPLLANPSTVALYAELGVRQVLLAYNRANEAAGGCYEAGAPLTALGAEFVRACEEAGHRGRLLAHERRDGDANHGDRAEARGLQPLQRARPERQFCATSPTT